MHHPLDQFKIRTLFEIPLSADYIIPFTNTAAWMGIAWLLITLFLVLSSIKLKLIPNRSQAASEMLFNMVSDMIESTAGEKGLKYMPLIFSIFIFILVCNLCGMLPYSFTPTSHIAVTFTLAIIIFIVITIIGFLRHGTHYFSLFLPKGIPIFMAPLMIFIELFAYLMRPISLSVRLAANMTAGHVVLKVLASFVMMAGFLGVLPFLLLTIITAFEIFIAILQAYIFTILTCVYLNDAVNLH